MISFILNKLNKNKKFRYYFCTPWIYAIGTCSEQIDIAHRVASNENKKLILLKLFIFKKFLKYNVCNDRIFSDLDLNLNKSKIYFLLKVIFTAFVNIEFLFVRSCVIFSDKFIKLKIPEYWRFPQVGMKELFYNNKKLFNSNYDDIQPYPNKIKIKTIKDVQTQLISEFNKIFQINGKRIVCLHVRDSIYRNDQGRREHRNSKIENYKASIDYLIDKGFTIIRLGGENQKSFDYKDKNYFELDDKQNLKYSILLIEICEFFIGTSSGPIDTAFLFEKPTLLTNAFTILGYPRNDKDRVIYRNIELNGQKISLIKFLNLPFFYHDILYMDKNDLRYIENTPNEILNGVKEFLNNFQTNKFEKTSNQININKLLVNNMRKYFYDKSNRNTIINHQSGISFIKWNKSQNGTICNFQINSVEDDIGK